MYMTEIDVTNAKDPFFDCNERERVFVHLLVEGVPQHTAYNKSYNSTSKDHYHHARQAKKLLAGKAGIYYRSLMSEVLSTKLAPFILTREQRLEMLTSAAFMALTEYDERREPQQAAILIKAVNTMNAMTGDNAPTELNIVGQIIDNNTANLSAHEITSRYKEMMRNMTARVKQNKTPETIIENEADDDKSQ